jgi:hypothetical protein
MQNQTTLSRASFVGYGSLSVSVYDAVLIFEEQNFCQLMQQLRISSGNNMLSICHEIDQQQIKKIIF